MPWALYVKSDKHNPGGNLGEKWCDEVGEKWREEEESLWW